MSGQELDFWAYGVPAPQGSKKIGRHPATRRPLLVDDNSKALKPWRETVEFYARRAMRGLHRFEGPVRIELHFFLPRPQSHFKKDRTLRASAPLWPAVKPDTDKLERAVFDSLTSAGVWADDSRAVMVYAQKAYADAHDPGVQVRIFDLAEEGEL
ncbi:RusA family crossover junction endodeoxyribonuclease [Paenarthrobacter sp. NPDC089714]|uniref:RusA family crossover junction endodeoxyribonuclease n=1 Tax=Paenarthrobacter sp. NPDC089714 TaxID=3364377 RepID=UPI00381AECA1